MSWNGFHHSDATTQQIPTQVWSDHTEKIYFLSHTLSMRNCAGIFLAELTQEAVNYPLHERLWSTKI